MYERTLPQIILARLYMEYTTQEHILDQIFVNILTFSLNKFTLKLASESADPMCQYRACTGPVLGLYWSHAGSIGPVQARYWQPTACLQGMLPLI